MRYLADLLTSTRFILAIIILFLSIFSGSPESVFIIFIIAELTDAFDGTCARKWPFPKDKVPRYRKYAAKFDIISDVALAGFQVIFLMTQINRPIGTVILVYYLVAGLFIEFLVYGKLFGHPDDCTKNCLLQRNFPLAKKIILARRYIYTLCIGTVNALILFATNWSDVIKYVLFAFGCSIFVFAWFFLAQRRQNISRDAVDIEKRLTRKSQKSKHQ